MPQRPEPAGKRALHGLRLIAFQILGQAERLRARRSAGAPRAASSSRSPARFTRRKRRSPSKANTATSISSITLRSSVVASSAPRRCARSVAPMAFTCSITSPKASSSASAARADGIVAFAHGFEQIGQRPQRRGDALAHRCRTAPPDHARSPRVSVHCTLGRDTRRSTACISVTSHGGQARAQRQQQHALFVNRAAGSASQRGTDMAHSMSA